jgi:hypothetical protein
MKMTHKYDKDQPRPTKTRPNANPISIPKGACRPDGCRADPRGRPGRVARGGGGVPRVGGALQVGGAVPGGAGGAPSGAPAAFGGSFWAQFLAPRAPSSFAPHSRCGTAPQGRPKAPRLIKPHPPPPPNPTPPKVRVARVGVKVERPRLAEPARAADGGRRTARVRAAAAGLGGGCRGLGSGLSVVLGCRRRCSRVGGEAFVPQAVLAPFCIAVI